MLPILLEFGDLTLHTYGVMLAVGFLLAIFVALREARRLGIEANLIMDLAFYLLMAALVGSRLIYVISHWEEFQDDPLNALRFWRGGLVFYGGLIFAFLAGLWYVRKYRLNFPKLADLIAPSIALGQAVGRLGCFAAGCCYGLPTDVPWACTFTDPVSLAPRNIPLHPTQLYESAATFAIFITLLSMRRKGRFRGKLFWYYLLFYSLARFVIEFFRGDPRGFVIPGILSMAQAIGLGVILLTLLILFRKKPTSLLPAKRPEYASRP